MCSFKDNEVCRVYTRDIVISDFFRHLRKGHLRGERRDSAGHHHFQQSWLGMIHSFPIFTDGFRAVVHGGF
jgi:hypothetical protein